MGKYCILQWEGQPWRTLLGKGTLVPLPQWVSLDLFQLVCWHKSKEWRGERMRTGSLLQVTTPQTQALPPRSACWRLPSPPILPLPTIPHSPSILPLPTSGWLICAPAGSWLWNKATNTTAICVSDSKMTTSGALPVLLYGHMSWHPFLFASLSL